METDEKRRGGKEAAALSGGHLCHVCGYQYPNPHPSAKLRRSHRKHCSKALPSAAAAAAVAEVDEAVVGFGVCVGAREDGAGNRNSVGGTLLGEDGGRRREEIGAGEANGGGAALRGSVGEVHSSVEHKVIAAEHSSPTCTGAQVIATELSENRLINSGSSENVFLEDTEAQIDASELSENGLVDCNSISIEIVNKGSGTELLVAHTNGSQNIVGHPAEREDSFDEYQDASPFLHQSDSEDGTAPSSVFSTEMNNLNAISAESSATTNVNSLETNGLLKDPFSGEPNMTDLSADSKVGHNLEEGALRLAGHEVNLKLVGPYEQAVNVDYTQTDMVDSKSDEASVHSEMISCLNASSLQETRLVILEPESESTCSRKVEGFMEDRMHVLHTMPEASPRPVVGSDNVQLETINNPSTNPMSIGSDLNVVCTDNTAIDFSLELPKQKRNVEDVPDGSQPVENSIKKTLRCSIAGFQDDLPVTKKDDIPVTNVDDVEFTFEERPQTDTVEENLSIQKTNGATKEEVCNRQIDPKIPTEDQFLTSQKHDTILIDQASSVKNPFNLDDDRNEDLFELPTESCFLEVPNAVESRQQVDSTSPMVDQPTVSNQTRMAEVQQCHNSNERILSVSSASENGIVGSEDIPVSSSSELVNKTCLTDHGLQENGRTCDFFVPSQAASTELSTISMQDISTLSEVEEIMQTEDASAMAAVHGIDCETKQAINTTENDTYASNVEEKKLIEGTAAGMNEVRQTNYVEEQTQASNTKELSAVQNIGNFEENKQTEDTDAKETNTRFIENDDELKTETAKEMAAAESTCSVEEKQPPNIMVGQDGSNNKLNEEIGSTGAQLNSGRVRVPLKVLLAEASKENQVKKPSTKERVLSFRRWVTKESNLSDDHHWSSPAKLPHKDVGKSFKEKKQLWMPFICCHSVR